MKSSMKSLAFSTNAFKKNTLEEAIDSIAGAGYGAIELMADLHHAYPATFDDGRRRDVAKRLGDLGLVVSNINAFTHFVDGDTYHPTWIESDPKLLAKRIDHTRRCLDLAHEFGAATVSIQPGGPLQTSGMLSENAYEQFAYGIDQCLATAVAAGVILAIAGIAGSIVWATSIAAHLSSNI